ncbi:hypothetical protein Hdeb2414_s0601g00922591 [Helianthus debilis subsp. tardiflorus]
MPALPNVGASMYKRMPSRDGTNSVDLEDDSEYLQDDMVQEYTDPPLRHSLPHVLVASIVSFLFGYHLGFVLNLNISCFYFSSTPYKHIYDHASILNPN